VSMYKERLSKLQCAVASANLDVFLITSTDNIYYLTGFKYEPFERAFFIVIRPSGVPIIITPRIEAENVGSISVEHRIVEYDDYPAMPGATYMDAIKEVIGDNEEVGVEPSMSAELFTALSGYAPRVLPAIERLRLVKSRYEIACIEKAAKYSDLGIRMIMEVAKMGASIQDGYDRIPELRKAIIEGEGYFDQYVSSIWLGVWAAPFSAQPHRFPEKTDVFQEGPNVALSFLRVNGYSAETERCCFVHKPSAEQAEIYGQMVEACEIAYRMLKPGVSCHDVDHAVMTFLRDEGYTENLLHRTGHGIGMGGHEGPWVAEGSDNVLQENMVISVEPGIYWRGKGGYRQSDTVLITNNGYRKLTDVPSDIHSMTLQW